MKKINLTCLALTLIGTLAFAAADHKPIKGPKGGKVLEIEPLHAEFFVNTERKVEVAFYAKDMKPVPVTDQSVNVIAEAKSGKTKLEMEKKGDILLSKTALPEGDGYTIVVQIKIKADAKLQIFRVTYHTEICKECNMAEYACICESHGGAAHEGHGH